jgi:hypothetical protein
LTGRHFIGDGEFIGINAAILPGVRMARPSPSRR